MANDATFSAPGAPRAVPRAAVLRLAVLTLALGLAAGCASTGARSLSLPELQRLAAARGLDPDTVELPFAVDTEMRRWLASIKAHGPAERRVTRLLRELLAKDGLGIRYDAESTGTATEVFRSRHGNCLGFTQLFVGLGRELGVPVYFLVVEDVESYEKRGDLVVLSGHVTAGIGPAHDLKILEFSLGPEIDYRLVRPVSDLTAVALFYSNRGAELLTEGRASEAIAALEIAVALDPELPSGWVNLGVARRRSGDSVGAASSYRKALEVDPEAASAYQNLAALLRLEGRNDEAEELLRVVARTGSRNPFSYLDLGDLSLARGRIDEARAFFRRAQRLYPDHPEPLAALGLAAVANGEHRAARRWLERARRLDPENPRVARLEEELEPKQSP